MDRFAQKLENPVQTDQIVAELLSRGDMNDDTVVELNRILEEWRAGKLDPDDDAYLRALHAKVFDMPIAEAEPIAAPAGYLDGLDIAGWRDRALRAEAELADLRDATKTS